MRVIQRRATRLGVVVVLAMLAGSCGSSDDSDGASGGARMIDVEMLDVAFSPMSVEVAAGEKVTFVFRNRGKVDHDAFIGDEEAQVDHEREMRDMSDMEHGGGDALTVEPGKTRSLTHTFDEPGTTLIGCHEPGHYAAGMKIDVTVSPRR
jgi:uncharacterized cupredoxin-like copper-binding protein